MTTTLYFNGVNEKIDIPYSAGLNPESFTVEVWAKVMGHRGNWRSPITSRGDYPQTGYLLYAGDDDRWQFWVGNGSAWTPVRGPAVELNAWVHVAATYDISSGAMTLYVGGQKVGTGKATMHRNTARPLRIGAGATEGNGTYWFDGELAEVRVWNRVRTAEDIQSTMNQRMRGDESGLVGYWPLDEGAGTDIHAYGGTGHSGTLINAPADAWRNDEALPVPSRQLSSVLDFRHLWAGSPDDWYGNADLQAQESPKAGVSLSGLQASPFTRSGFELQTSEKSRWEATDSGLGDFAGGSMLVAGLFQTLTREWDKNIFGLVGKRDAASSSNGWEIGLDGEGRVMAMVHGTEGLRALHVDGVACDTQWHTFVLVYNQSAGQVSLHTEAGSSKVAAIPGDCTNSTAMSIGANRLRAAGCHLAFVAMASGSQVESVDAAALAKSLHQQYVQHQ